MWRWILPRSRKLCLVLDKVQFLRGLWFGWMQNLSQDLLCQRRSPMLKLQDPFLWVLWMYPLRMPWLRAKILFKGKRMQALQRNNWELRPMHWLKHMHELRGQPKLPLRRTVPFVQHLWWIVQNLQRQKWLFNLQRWNQVRWRRRVQVLQHFRWKLSALLGEGSMSSMLDLIIRCRYWG
jgi:hypothetical protein